MNSETPLHLRVEELRQAGDLAQARALVQEGLSGRVGGERGRLLGALGRVLLAGGENAPAGLALEEALGLLDGPGSGAERGELLLDLSRARRRQGDLEGALEAARRASDLFGGDGDGRRRALALQGKVHYAGRDWAAAREAFSRALEASGEEPPAWRLEHALARACERGGDPVAAREHSSRARQAGWSELAGLQASGVFEAAALGHGLLSATEPLVPGDPEGELRPQLEGLTREDLLELGVAAGGLLAGGEPDALLEGLLERALAWSGAERGYAGVARPETPPRLEVRAARARGGGRSSAPEDPGSRALVEACLASAAPTRGEGERTAVALPLLGQAGPAVGALYLEGGQVGPRLEVLTRLGGLACERALRQARLAEAYDAARRGLEERTGAALGVLGRSKAIQTLLRQIEQLRDQEELPVLIEGETGTGKELIARAIHRLSRRRAGPFVLESCAALPEGLAEAMLVGAVEGAFAGSRAAQRGAFERAQGGTLFLEDVSEMPARMQAALLQVLETGEVRPLGAPGARRVDCRIVCASREPLADAVRRGRFREDLYLRLSVVRLELPPLRQRKDDVLELAEAFLHEEGRSAFDLSPAACEALLRHEWQGNVRELRHALERASLLAGSGAIEPRHLGLEDFRTSSAMRRLRTSSGAQAAAKVDWHGYVLNKRQVELLEYLQAHGVATNREYVQLVNVSVPTGWRDLKDLLDKGLIRAEGQGRNTVYRLSEPGGA